MITRFITPKILFALAMFSLVLIPLSGTEWYGSSAGGVPGAPLYSGQALENGWSLSIEFSGDRELRSLYRDGKAQSVTVLIRSNGRLVAREQLNAQGELVSRVEYAYDAEGNPRAAVIHNSSLAPVADDPEIDNERRMGNEPPIGDELPVNDETRVDSGLRVNNQPRVELSSRINADGEQRRLSGGSGDDWFVSDSDEKGRLTRKRLVNGAAVVSETVFDRDPNGLLSEERIVSGDELKVRRYDNQGRLVEEITSYAGLTTLVRNYSWAGSDLVRVEERGQGRLSIREMIWKNGRMVREIRFVDGVKVLETEWDTGDQRVETLYRDGAAIIRVYWNGSTRLREEFLRNGTVVRVKEESE